MHGTDELIYSIAIQLSPTRPGTIRATVGHQAHAAFLRAVRGADPALAEVLHHPRLQQRPFTVSPLLGVGQARDGQVPVRPEETYTLRFTVLMQRIFEQFMGRFLRGERPVLRLGQTLFLIKEILATPESSPWADYVSLGALWQAAGERAGEPLIRLEFLSPTAFSFGQRPWGRLVQPLPEARLVFGSLARTWRAFGIPGIVPEPRAVEAYAEENVAIQRLEGLETHMLHYGRYPQLGFVGRVTFRVMDRGPESAAWRHTLHALAAYAFYAGVGYKTAMGMGQCRQCPNGCGDQQADDSLE